MRGQCSVKGATIRGVKAEPVEVEVVVGSGIPAFCIVGMPDAAVQEARERVRAAIRASGFTMPNERVVVNLAPGDLRKTGSGFDLPIAVGVLVATGQLDPHFIEGAVLVGELSLEGQVRPVCGVLAYALCARRQGCNLICSSDHHQLLSLDGLVLWGARSLADFHKGCFTALKSCRFEQTKRQTDFRDISGHDMAKRALQVAAAGGHGVLMMGPPGSGKTMLASRLPSIMPPLTQQEVLEAALVHSVAGEDISALLKGIRPFRNPHHSASLAGLVGGGSPPHPGEISLAHTGVLFLDELAEFKPSVLQGIRQPLESGRVCISRVDGKVVFPASFMLVAATNPCPCGYSGDTQKSCTCTLAQINTYQGRIGGPLMDRIDIHIDVRRVAPSEVLASGKGSSSQNLRERVMQAWEYASWRKSREHTDNTAAALIRSCVLSDKDREFFEEAARCANMSGRAIVRTLSVARTIADMEQKTKVNKQHLCEALGMRLREGVGA